MAAEEQNGKPRVAVIGTGGTISSVGVDSLDLLDYVRNNRIYAVDELLAQVPELDRIAEDYPPSLTVSAYSTLDGEQVWQAELPALSGIGASGNLVTAGDLVFQVA